MRLHIGCKGPVIPGFTRLDVVQWGDVDYVRDARDLSCFADNSVTTIYCSHILEHFPAEETVNVLTEWARVIAPGGTAYIAVPDFDRLVDLYLASGRMFTQLLQDWNHGGQHYPLDVHLRSFNFALLSRMMSKAGFSDVERISTMPYGLNDCSFLVDTSTRKPISLCVKGTK